MPGEVILPGDNEQLDPEEGLILPASPGEGTMKPSEAQEPVRGVPPIRLVRTQVQTLGLQGELDHLRDP
jgi:hypothetical protein